MRTYRDKGGRIALPPQDIPFKIHNTYLRSSDLAPMIIVQCPRCLSYMPVEGRPVLAGDLTEVRCSRCRKTRPLPIDEGGS